MNSDMWSFPRIIPVPCNEVDDFDFKFVAEKRVDTNIFSFSTTNGIQVQEL
jgi:hypothetical protein